MHNKNSRISIPTSMIPPKYSMPRAIPIITAIGMQFSYVMTGSALAETVFGWPGIGRLVVDSINKRDTPMVTGSIILCCVLMAVINLAVDIIYAFCDPRIKAQYSGKG